MNPYLKILRPETSLLGAMGAIVGALISGSNFSILFLYIALSVFFITSAGMVINDYYDYEIDQINAPERPIPSGQISREKAFYYSLVMFALGLIFAFMININCFILALANTVVEFFYAKIYKRWWLLGNILVSWLSASVFIFGALITSNFQLTGIMFTLSFLANMGREIFKSIEDIKGDKAVNSDTLPIASGIKTAREIARGFIAFAILLSPLPYFSGLLKANYLKTILLGDTLFLYSLFQGPTRNKKTTKLAMFFVLLALILSLKI
ncbi:MAG: UbiA family prenyltransferase [Patescibacteria group bacterium]